LNMILMTTIDACEKNASALVIAVHVPSIAISKIDAMNTGANMMRKERAI
jgi:hypothetical protein